MAITTYKVQFQKNFMSYNGGEFAYFDAMTAERLVAEGIATAIDVLPGTVSEPPQAIQPATDVVDDGGLPAPTSAADSAALQSEAGQLPGG